MGYDKQRIDDPKDCDLGARGCGDVNCKRED